MLSKKFISPSSVTIGKVFLNNRSTIVTSATADIVRAFLSKLSLIKNMGNKMLTIIVDIQPVTNMALQLFTNKLIIVSTKVKVEVNSVKILKGTNPIIAPPVKNKLMTKTYK